MKTETVEHNELELIIKSTAQTPLIKYSVENSKLEFIGRSIPEDVAGFYEPVMRWLKKLALTEPERLKVELLLDYVNSNSTKAILDILKTIQKLKEAGTITELVWYYEEDDEDMMEFGNDLSYLIKTPVKIISLSEKSFDERTDASKLF
jgi:predicted DNA-binding antitoxin AbrB/MazE fold protein